MATRRKKRPTKREPNSLELAVIKSLKKHRKSRRVRIEYESERLTYYLARSYVPDVVVTFPRGRRLYIEAKGWLRSSDRTKMIAVKEANPDLDIRFVFAKDNLLYKGAKSRYSDWCVKNCFKYHIGTDIPKDWLENAH